MVRRLENEALHWYRRPHWVGPCIPGRTTQEGNRAPRHRAAWFLSWVKWARFKIYGHDGIARDISWQKNRIYNQSEYDFGSVFTSRLMIRSGLVFWPKKSGGYHNPLGNSRSSNQNKGMTPVFEDCSLSYGNVMKCGFSPDLCRQEILHEIGKREHGHVQKNMGLTCKTWFYNS